jgi:integrase
MPLFKKPGSPFWWYSIYFRGKRYRKSTMEKTKTAAAQVEAAATARLMEGVQPTRPSNKAVTLHMLSVRFLKWVEGSHKLEPSSRRFYAYGWRLLSFSRLATMPLDQITTEIVECTEFRRPVIDRRTKEPTGEIVTCSASYTNQALRTLKAMLNKAQRWGMLQAAPHISAVKANGRDRLIDKASESAFHDALSAPMKHRRTRQARERAWLFLVILQDTGMRPNEVYSMRIDDVRWSENRIWIPKGKTANSRRFVGMSDRLKCMLDVWCYGREGWVFPSPKSKSGHIQTIKSVFLSARQRSGVDKRIVLYSARHTFATDALAGTGNIFAVSKAMGHAGVESMKPYQHPDTSPVSEAINLRNRHTFRHNQQVVQ